MIYVLLGAGSGTRMGALTSDRAKILVDVAGKPILAHNLDHIHAAAPQAGVVVISGYAADTVEAFVRDGHWTATETLHNPDFASAGPLRSIRVALDHLAGKTRAITIGNGDTIFEPPALAALAAAASDIALLVSDPEPDAADPDDVQVQVEAGRIVVAAKRIAPPGTLPVSAGLLRIDGEAALSRVRALVEALIAEEDGTGRSLTWHSLLAALAEQGEAAVPVRIPPLWWCEFDSGDCIDRYRARHPAAA